MISGATLILLKPEGNLNLAYVTKTIEKKQVTFVVFSPTFTRALVAYFGLAKTADQCFATLQRVNSGGEPLPWLLTKQLHALLPAGTVHHNIHGASECCIGISYRVPRDNSDKTENNISHEIIVPCGRPSFNMAAYLVNENLQLITEIGQLGEILYSGGGVFKRYLNDVEKTEKVLIKLPYITGGEQVLYRTGDIAKYTKDGNLVVVGRQDFQFKIQDQRIEAAEVEHFIMAYSPSLISNCVVSKAVHEEQDHLIAYLAVGSNGDKIPIDDIRRYCEQHLASYSVPSLFIVLPKLPVLPTGKIDRSQVRHAFFVHVDEK
ncbi:unnamed protein product [Rotaria sp. Silwood1]|nr:unnamed protein product [Rotaria sp. Silwood1]CAF1312858.1 unnamed protein product [Rotaria sp. Silwood1]CAF1314547.1 unnamed protein product [Rotaria sp. Silwood1]CAF3521711.1 unnamed protein product [Rotaria sp. Silwood1]CAF3523444.1 unnamed protein product [Rotaria sp. Silwood1]